MYSGKDAEITDEELTQILNSLQPTLWARNPDRPEKEWLSADPEGKNSEENWFNGQC